MTTTATWIARSVRDRHDVEAPLMNGKDHSSANVYEISPETPLTNRLAATQNALLLHAIKEKYTLVTDHAVPPIVHQDEVLIEVSAVGLNPIDWKAPYV